MSKHVLGLDLGVGSIGWCLIALDGQDQPAEILGMGSRIVPLTTDDLNDFSQGKAISKNQKRTTQRTIRKGLDRYQLRRKVLSEKLAEHGMLPDKDLMQLPVLDLWELRARAASPGEKLSLPEIGRVLYHINQKRGYKHAKSDEAEEATKRGKEQGYVATVKGRYAELQQEGATVGQHFARKLKEHRQESPSGGFFYNYRIKDQVYPREAYIEEFDRIMEVQSVFYSEVLTPVFIQELRDKVIFFQRPLKSCKGLVSFCEFEKQERVVQLKRINREGKEELQERKITIGPKVAPKSSPIAQLCKLWESIHNIRIYYPDGKERPITLEEKRKLLAYLQTHDKLTFTALKKELKISDRERLWCDKLLKGGIKGDMTRALLRKALAGYKRYEPLLRMDLELRDSQEVDPETGLIRPIVDESYLSQSLYRLWHILYSIEEREAMRRALIDQLDFKREDLDGGLLDKLYQIDFAKQGYSNKSAKFICKLLPHLQEDHGYSEACELAGKRHSASSLTKEELEERPLLGHIPLLQRNELRQPIVEKILNQMINLVNALRQKYGSIDEVRVELARELKMSREEREKTYRKIGDRETENKEIAECIKEYKLYPTKSRIQKYRLCQESGEQCLYCGRSIDVVQFLRGDGVEIEHIIPKSILYDDSSANKTCACSRCNKDKGNRTAYEYILAEGREAEYLDRLESLFHDGKLSYSKRRRLQWKKADIPADFIERQLRLTQYIARQAQEILRQGIRRVGASEGSVTAKLRHLWEYDDILRDLNFERYQSMGETEIVSQKEKDGSITKSERIKDWSKRKDHRHHAIDALVVACTRQGHIQRLNSLNSEEDSLQMQEDSRQMREEMGEQRRPTADKHSILENWLILQPHFSPQEVKSKVAEILVSFRPGKRTVSTGRNTYLRSGKKETQAGVLIPRGPLSDESLYGQILRNGEPTYVKKVALESLSKTQIEQIVDLKLRREMIARAQPSDGAKLNPKLLLATPFYSDAAGTQRVRSVRVAIKQGKNSIVPLRYNESGKAITFVNPGNNHHVGIYRTPEGKLVESCVTFWQAVDRVRYGLPAIIRKPREVLDQLLLRDDIPEALLANLPASDWEFVEYLQVNEMFLIGLTDEEIQTALAESDLLTLSKHLYRVQKVSSKNYMFRYHLETEVADEKNNTGDIPKFYHIQGLSTAYLEENPRRVKVNLLGEISLP